MSTAEYPRNAVCAECGEQIRVFYSQGKQTEYACNTNPPDFHKCRGWSGDATQTQLAAEPEPSPSPEPLAEPQTAQQVFVDSTFKMVELTTSVTRKVGRETIAGIPEYENISFLVAMRAELELGADVQLILTKMFAEGKKGIDQQIEDTRRELSK